MSHPDKKMLPNTINFSKERNLRTPCPIFWFPKEETQQKYSCLLHFHQNKVVVDLCFVHVSVVTVLKENKKSAH